VRNHRSFLCSQATATVMAKIPMEVLLKKL